MLAGTMIAAARKGCLLAKFFGKQLRRVSL